MAQLGFFFDGSRCTGCKTCVVACKDGFDLGVGVAFRRVYECVEGCTEKDGAGICSTTCRVFYLSLGCNHCSRPVCIEVCPTQAMAKDEATGLVAVNTRKCISCGYCHLACPYNAPQVDKSRGHSVKCEGCPDRLAAGEAPLCVLACPARALGFGTAEAMAARGERASTPPLPPAEETCPNLYIKPSRDSRAAGGGVAIGNVAETR